MSICVDRDADGKMLGVRLSDTESAAADLAVAYELLERVRASAVLTLTNTSRTVLADALMAFAEKLATEHETEE